MGGRAAGMGGSVGTDDQMAILRAMHGQGDAIAAARDQRRDRACKRARGGKGQPRPRVAFDPARWERKPPAQARHAGAQRARRLHRPDRATGGGRRVPCPVHLCC